MAAALEAARTGARVRLLERQKKLGRRLAVTGNGRGNIGHETVTAAEYNERAQATLTKQFPELFARQYRLNFLRSFGVYPEPDEAGRWYPVSRQASSVVWAMHDALAHAGVSVELGKDVLSWSHEQTGAFFEVKTEQTTYRGKCLVMAVGGLAQEQIGGGEHARRLLACHDFAFHKEVPVLVPVLTAPAFPAAAGVRLQASVQIIGSDRQSLLGEYQITARGLSGIAALQLSRHIEKGDALSVDLLPSLSKETLREFLFSSVAIFPDRSSEFFLDALLPQKLAAEICRKQLPRKAYRELTPGSIEAVIKYVKMLRLQVVGMDNWSAAQLMRGGVSLAEVDFSRMASVRIPGLFLAGEMLDVDGDTGGYNLAWCFMSGQRAGRFAAYSSINAR